jgi:hypothetical protein
MFRRCAPRGLAALALFVCSLLPIATASAGDARRPAEAGRVRADRKLRAFHRSVQGKLLYEVRPLGNGCVASVCSAIEPVSRQALIIRRPPRVTRSVRLHNALFKLAEQLGRGEMVPLATEMTTLPEQTGVPGNFAVMITEHAGPAFVAANHLPAEWQARIPEPTRVLAALLDYLSRQQDRMRKNLMIDESGEIRLIDHDYSLGHNNPFTSLRVTSLFHPGRTLSYRSRQDSFDDLPAEARELCDYLHAFSVAELAAIYGIKDAEAQVLSTHARRVRKLGLTLAMGGEPGPVYHGGAAPMRFPDFGYTPSAGLISARAGRAAAGHLVYGPYVKFEPGRYAVRFNLRSNAPLDPVGEIEIYNAHGAASLAKHTIHAGELQGGDWKALEIEAPVADPNNLLEFRVFWSGGSNLDVGEIATHRLE